MCYHCKNKGHLKANCPDRQLADRKTSERTWKARKRKRSQTTGGGNVKKTPPNIRQEAETIQNIIELTDTGLEKAMTEDWSTFMNALKIVKVDRIRDTLQGKKDHTKMYVPTLVRTAPSPGGRASVTMALPDSGNLLAHAAIDAKFHQQLGVPIEETNIKARAANKQSLEIQGVSKGIYIRFPNVSKFFLCFFYRHENQVPCCTLDISP